MICSVAILIVFMQFQQVFANKQDSKGAMNSRQVSDAMGLPEIKNRQWSIQETSALKGSGLFEGFDWLVTCIKGGE